MLPNCAGSAIDKTAGATYFSTMKSSANLDTAEVSEIGLKCLLISRTGFTFGIGVMFALFQTIGCFSSW
jgi:hypothetical protein